MNKSFTNILSEYISSAMKKADYEKLEDNTYAGKIDECKGVVAFGESLEECREELQSVLEGWILLGLKMNHQLPVLNGINLNQEPELELMESD